MLTGRIWTGHLALILVVPSRLVRTMSTVFAMVMRARRLSVAAVASHDCLPPSVSVVIAEMRCSGFKQPLALINGCLQLRQEYVSLWQLRQCPRFSRKVAARAEGVRTPLHRRGYSVLHEALTANTSS